MASPGHTACSRENGNQKRRLPTLPLVLSLLLQTHLPGPPRPQGVGFLGADSEVSRRFIGGTLGINIWGREGAQQEWAERELGCSVFSREASASPVKGDMEMGLFCIVLSL